MDSELVTCEDDGVDDEAGGESTELPVKEEIKGNYVSIHSSDKVDNLAVGESTDLPVKEIKGNYSIHCSEVDDQAGGESTNLPAEKMIKKTYVSIYRWGFKDFLLNSELLSAIKKHGFKDISNETKANNVLATSGDGEANDQAGRESTDLPVKKIKQSYSFRDFLLKPELLLVIEQRGFKHPSKVQQECIPQAILGYDILCQAASKTGKTTAFVLATLQQLEPVTGQVSVLVICNGKKLAEKVYDEYERFSEYMGTVTVGLFTGKMGMMSMLLKRSCPHIVVGQSRQILSLAREKTLNLKHIKHIVLHDLWLIIHNRDTLGVIQEIFSMTPHDKQVMTFIYDLNLKMFPEVCEFLQDVITDS